MKTGKAAEDLNQDVMQYRGVAFRNETWGIINMTGSNEGISFGGPVRTSDEWLTFDSALSRPILTEYSGQDTKVKGMSTLVFDIAENSLDPCNWTFYGEWADMNEFNPTTYLAVMNNIPANEFGRLMGNPEELAQYLRNSSLEKDFGEIFGVKDARLDRCMVPDQMRAVWDMSLTFACPTLYSFPRYLDASTDFISLTGRSGWNASKNKHSYGLALEPITGIAVKGHKTYQISHIVSKTPVMYPDLWTVSGSAESLGMPEDFIMVPVYWVKMWWEPRDGDALLLRAMTSAIWYLHSILVIGWPAGGGLTAISCIILLFFSKEAKFRRREIATIQQDTAPSLKLSKAQRQENRLQNSIRQVEPMPDGMRSDLRKAIDPDSYLSEEEMLDQAYLSS